MNRRNFLSAVAALAAGAVVSVDALVGENVARATILKHGEPVFSGTVDDVLEYLRAERPGCTGKCSR